MLLNFCLLLTCTFLLSLTYRKWPLPERRSEHALRVGLAAVTSVLLLLYTQPTGPYKIDLRFVPLALVTLRYGVAPGLFVAAAPVALRLMESELGGLTALVNALSVVGLSGVLRGHLNFRALTRADVWKVPVPYLGVGLLMFFTPHPPNVSPWVLYPGMLALHSLSTLAVLGVVNARLRLLRVTSELERQVLTDELTGLGNRSRFDRDLARLETGAQLVMLDVDNFRSLNERHGTPVGDRALRYIGQVMHDVAPHAAYRLSGEEFALLLNVGGEAQARALVERLQAQIAEPGGLPWASLTLSAGMATRLLRETPGELTHRADEALYLAKTNGRNRLVVSQYSARRTSTEGPLPDIRPRYSLWQAQRTTVNLLTQRRTLTDDDWHELLRLAVETVDGVEAGTLNIREGSAFRVCASEGYGEGLTGLSLSERSQLKWYGGSLQDWLAGRPRVIRLGEIQRAWASADEAHQPGQERTFAQVGRRDQLRANLCFPVVLGGEVIAHLNLDSLSTEDVFTPAVMQDAGVFAQQIAALLQLQERWRELEQLARLHGDLSLSLDDDAIAGHLTDTAHALLRTSYTVLLRYDAAQDMLISAARAGSTQPDGPPVRLRRGEGMSWQALETGQVQRVADIMTTPGAYRPENLEPDRRALMAVPLLSHQRQPLGVLCLLRSEHRPFQASDEALAAMLASVGTRVMERSTHLNDLRATLEASLNTLGVALEARDFETQGHTQRVRDLALMMGAALHLPDDQMTALRHGATLHDIGKLCIPDAVLLKPGRLTPDERAVVEQHAPLGADLVARIPFLHPEAHHVVRHHHERWDGAGYPDRLAADRIPLLARIFALCDVYDALISVRPYKAALTHAQALDIIREGRGTQFDPALTDLFCQLVRAEDAAGVSLPAGTDGPSPVGSGPAPVRSG
ncbi:HD domain-containing phosphohydrolase [Deinococcus depolymerans]|uniref:Diguanylate cyclase n=1 Tax=Deinococcus depolymerans TaxID=392408 RepID=A0ABN1CMX8_9DEIO